MALACQDLVTADSATEAMTAHGPASPSLRIKPLRLQQLLSVLERKLGCEVRPGKGSEITVYRRGGRKFSLGRHHADYVVPLVTIKQLLRNIGVKPHEWLACAGVRVFSKNIPHSTAFWR